MNEELSWWDEELCVIKGKRLSSVMEGCCAGESKECAGGMRK